MANSALSGNIQGLASASSPGLVGTGAQTFAGDKTLTGLITASGGILNTGLTGANSTTAYTAGSGKVGETIIKRPSANVPFGAHFVVTNITSQLFQPGIWAVYGVGVTSSTVAGTLNYWGYGISTVSATIQTPYFMQWPNGSGFNSTTADGYHLVPTVILNLTTATTVYLISRLSISSAPTGNYTTTSALIGTRLA